MSRQKITFASEPGDRVPAWLLVPDARPGAPVRRPAVLCLHQTIAIGKDEPAGLGTNPDLDYARELAERGYVDHRPRLSQLRRVPPRRLRHGLRQRLDEGDLEQHPGDRRAHRASRRRSGRIGAIGHSLGGHNAIFTALFDPRIKAVVSSCGFNAFPYYYRGDITGWSHKGYMPRLRERYGLDLKKVPFDFPELIAALAPRAFFTSSPLHDANFAVEGVRVCLDAARPVYTLLDRPDHLRAIYPDADHSFPAAAREAAYAFLDRNLSPKPMIIRGLRPRRQSSRNQPCTRDLRRSALTLREMSVGYDP